MLTDLLSFSNVNKYTMETRSKTNVFEWCNPQGPVSSFFLDFWPGIYIKYIYQALKNLKKKDDTGPCGVTCRETHQVKESQSTAICS